MKAPASLYIFGLLSLFFAMYGCTSRVPQEAMSEQDKLEFSADSAQYQLLYATRKQTNLKADSIYSYLIDYSTKAVESIPDSSGRLLFWPIFVSGIAESQLAIVYAWLGNNGDTSVVIKNKSLTLHILDKRIAADTTLVYTHKSGSTGDTLSRNLLATFNQYKSTKNEIQDINFQIEFLRERWMGRLK